MKKIPPLPMSSFRVIQTMQPSSSDTTSDDFLQSSKNSKAVRVAIVDLGVWIGSLNTFIEKLNAAQSEYEFFIVRQVVPSWLNSQKPKLVAWLEQQMQRPLNERELETITPHVIFEEYLPFGKRIQKQLGIRYIFGLTPSRIAVATGEEEPQPLIKYIDYFSSSKQGIGLISTDEILVFSKQVKRPLIAGVGVLLIGAVLAETNSKIDFHVEDRGCLFDYCEERSDVKFCIKKAFIEDSCLKLLPRKRRAAALAMVDVINSLDIQGELA